jgi:hypothetical protein
MGAMANSSSWQIFPYGYGPMAEYVCLKSDIDLTANKCSQWPFLSIQLRYRYQTWNDLDA